MNTKKMMNLSMLLAIGIIFGYLESFIPTFVVGVKLGLANIVILIMLNNYYKRDCFLVLILRILIVSFLRGTFLQPPFFMSLGGGVLSFLIMIVVNRFKKLSLISVSVSGAVFHSIGQILVAILITETIVIAYYLPLIVLLSIFTGIFTGFVSMSFLNRYSHLLDCNTNTEIID